jgi:hypothetical protein
MAGIIFALCGANCVLMLIYFAIKDVAAALRERGEGVTPTAPSKAPFTVS